MYKNVLQSIDNIAIWPVISFVIFFLFFICLLWWVFTVDKKFVNEMSNLPISQTPRSENAKVITREEKTDSPNPNRSI